VYFFQNSQGTLKTFSLIRIGRFRVDVLLISTVVAHVTVLSVFFYLLGFIFYSSNLITGPLLIPVLITLTGLSCINIIILLFKLFFSTCIQNNLFVQLVKGYILITE